VEAARDQEGGKRLVEEVSKEGEGMEFSIGRICVRSAQTNRRKFDA
jgi:hypothetical protein